MPGQGLSFPSASTDAYDTRTIAAASFVPISRTALRTNGYAAVGDGGSALYVKVGATTTGGFQSADGAWWKVADKHINAHMFGAKGDGVIDDTAAIQAAIDFAIQNNLSDVNLLSGNYLTTDTIHLGWGNVYVGLSLMGPTRGGYTTLFPGANILPQAVDRPCVNIQGGRNCSIVGIGFNGRYIKAWITALAAARTYSSNAADWLDATNIPNGLGRYRPYAAITIDAYSGTRPGSGSYPDVTYPSWTGVVTQWDKNYSSHCIIDKCNFSGFAACIVTDPSGSDGNGDFTRMRDCTVEQCIYGICITHTQSRGVEIRNTNYNNVHTFMTNIVFGLQNGQLNFGLDNVTGGNSYQVFDLAPSMAGPLFMRALYIEAHVLIGRWGASSAGFQSALFFEGGRFSFGNDGGNLPSTFCRFHLEAQGKPVIKFVNSTFYSLRFVVIGPAQNGVTFDNCSWQTGQSYEAGSWGSSKTAALAIGYSQFGGMFVPRTTRHAGPNIIGMCEATHFNRSTLGLETVRLFDAAGIDTTELLMHSAATKWQDGSGRVWPILYRPDVVNRPLEVAGYFPIRPTQSGMIISGSYANASQVGGGAWASSVLEVGDLIYDQITYNLYVITSVTLNGGTTNYDFTAEQQNNFYLPSPNFNTPTPIDTINSGNGDIFIYKSSYVCPKVLHYGDFTTGSATVANVHKGDGAAGSLSSEVPVGMILAEDPSQSGTFGSAVYVNTRIATVTNGSPGSVTLTKVAQNTGRFALFPMTLVGGPHT